MYNVFERPFAHSARQYDCAGVWYFFYDPAAVTVLWLFTRTLERQAVRDGCTRADFHFVDLFIPGFFDDILFEAVIVRF
jgi:hypothetical protein